MKKIIKWFPALLILTVFLGGGAIVAHATENEKETIFEGVYINSIHVGSMTEAEALAEVETYVDELLSENIVLQMGEKSMEVSPEEIGLQWVNTTIAKEAYNVGRCGNLIKRFKEQKDLEKDSVQLRIMFEADEELLSAFLTENQGKVNVEAVNNGLKRENGEFKYVEGHEGIVMDMDATTARMIEFFADEYDKETTTFELVSMVDVPKGSKEELAKVKDLLGSFTTDYSTSAWGRSKNVANGVSKIDGSVIYPGETFSVYECVSPFTAENGYELAGSYENGTVVESYGGGICQVSTTLYMAVINAELEITERFPHSMIVTYVEPSMDAAIAGTYKDLKFTNNLEYPIYIEGYTKNKKVYFNVYGVETRSANRKVQYVSEVLETNEPTPEFRETSAGIGVVNRLQGAHVGYKACLWKVVTENGKEVSREKFNKSTYNASPAIYEIGMSSSHPEAVAAMKAAIATGDINAIKEAAAYWSDEAIAARQQSATPPSTGTTPPENGGNNGAGNGGQTGEGSEGGDNTGEGAGDSQTP